MKIKIFISIVYLTLLGCSQSPSLVVEGELLVKGSTPHSYLSIKDKTSHKTYKIKNKNSFDLIHMQKQNIKLKVEILKKSVGAGFPAVVKVLKVYDK